MSNLNSFSPLAKGKKGAESSNLNNSNLNGESAAKTVIFIILAYAFAVVCRFMWISWASAFPEFYWNGELMISTNDGYAFAEGARDMLAGFHQPNDLSFYGSPLSTLTYLTLKLTPFSIETIMLYMSVFLSALIVVPLVLAGREIGMTRAGFIAALLASVANSYYNRTMAGYYDTDMLTIVFPVFIIWGMTRLFLRKDRASHLIVALSILAYHWWYPSSFSLNVAFIVCFALYAACFARKKEIFAALPFMLLAISSGLDFALRFVLIIALYAFMVFKFELFFTRRVFWAVLIAAALVFAAFGGLNPIWFYLKFYLFRDFSDSSEASFAFFNVNQTIMESGIVPFGLFSERISGHLATLLLSIAGYTLLCARHKEFLVALPMAGLGFLALKGGLRFTIYAVPVMALGFGYLVESALNAAFGGKNAFKFERIKTAMMAAVTLFALLPMLAHIRGYDPLTVFMNSEVAVLDELKAKAGREDYVLAWWDYGYAIRYYSDVKTLIDGGKHLGKDNFAVSYALSRPQEQSAAMARLEVEYTEREFSKPFEARASSNLKAMMNDFNATDANEFANSVDSNLKLPSATRDIFYFLPDRMINIFPVVVKFSRLDLNSGKEFSDPLFVVSENFRYVDGSIELAPGLFLKEDATAMHFGGQNYRVNTFVHTRYDERGKLECETHAFDDAAALFVVYMEDYGRFIVMDKEMFGSAYVQLFVLENYDPALFEPVILSPSAKVYKVKK